MCVCHGIFENGEIPNWSGLYTHVSQIILWNSNFTGQVDDNPTTGPDKSTRKIVVDKRTTEGQGQGCGVWAEFP